MEKEQILCALPQLLLPWFQEYKRDLPWRHDREPYHIWLSEIMLQQTRVEAVKGYYRRFLATLPSVECLAKVDDELLHKLWEGLGYYSRVRNLKKAAIVICEDFGGIFPSDYNTILQLPGIGAYTAGAIASIAFDQPVPAVDGNVLRVFTRLMADSTPIDNPVFKKMVGEDLSKIYPAEAGNFTQALMELGATVCVPNGKPACDRCPCKEVCSAFRQGIQQLLPVKTPKKTRKVEERTVLILSCDGKYALEKRPSRGLLAGLWQFPNLPGKRSVQEILETKDLCIRDVKRAVERNHIFTHVEWKMVGIYLEVDVQGSAYTWMTAEEIQRDIAVPTAFRQFWEDIEDS